jgi:hypothetical protein
MFRDRSRYAATEHKMDNQTSVAETDPPAPDTSIEITSDEQRREDSDEQRDEPKSIIDNDESFQKPKDDVLQGKTSSFKRDFEITENTDNTVTIRWSESNVTYTGDYDAASRRMGGRGTYQWKDAQYAGDVVDGFRHGVGQHTLNVRDSISITNFSNHPFGFGIFKYYQFESIVFIPGFFRFLEALICLKFAYFSVFFKYIVLSVDQYKGWVYLVCSYFSNHKFLSGFPKCELLS